MVPTQNAVTPATNVFNECRIAEYRDSQSVPPYASMLREADKDVETLATRATVERAKTFNTALPQNERQHAQRTLEDIENRLNTMRAVRDELLARNHKHARDGSTIYQIVDAAGNIRVVDANGQALPAAAVYSYEVVALDVAPPAPVLAAASHG